jgi:hypothetical protein
VGYLHVFTNPQSLHSTAVDLCLQILFAAQENIELYFRPKFSSKLCIFLWKLMSVIMMMIQNLCIRRIYYLGDNLSFYTGDRGSRKDKNRAYFV